jgi:hypothetical protein
MFSLRYNSKRHRSVTLGQSRSRRPRVRSCLRVEHLEDRSMLSTVIPQQAPTVTVMSQNLSLGTDPIFHSSSHV